MSTIEISKQLAVLGGEPVRKEAMPARWAFGQDEIDAVNEVINYYKDRQTDPGYQGVFEERFCNAFAQKLGGGYADAVATGTAAIYVALAALDLPKGSEVIISPVTDSGPLNCIILQGYKPVVADSAPNSYNTGVKEFLDRVTENTSAFLAVHSAGEPLAIDEIVKEAHKRNIKVLEDCSQAPGAFYNGHQAGTVGDISAFSTMYRKNIASGGCGGLVFTKDQDLYHQALAHADRGKQIWRKDLYLNDPSNSLFPALNWNTDEISCAIGLSSLNRLEDTLNKRRGFIDQLTKRLEDESQVCTPYAYHKGFSPFYFPIFVDDSRINCTKNEFAKAIAAEGIGLLPEYGCLVAAWQWAHPYLVGNKTTPNAFDTRDRSFNYFVNEKYDKQELEDTIAAIKKVERYYLKD